MNHGLQSDPVLQSTSASGFIRTITVDEFCSVSLVSTQEQLIYQPVKLLKRHSQRVKDNKIFRALDKAFGLDCVEPDRRFKPSILTSLLDLGKRKELEFLIVVAMYNETPEHFRNTTLGIIKNIKQFRQRGIHPDRIACIYIVDGISPMMQTYDRNTQFFQHFFDPDMIKRRFSVENVENDIKLDPDDEIAHLFMQVIATPDHPEDYLQLIFCVKHLNKRKLNTHLWFFGGFCYALNPRFIQLLDVGTIPKAKSLWYLYEAMVVDKNCAGCCGEIKPLNPSIFSVAEHAQTVEYKLSHIFDKALESVFGFISVLPGAFSAYRWSAVKGEALWRDYFMSFRHPEFMDAYHSNIFLAEDRVLSLALVSRKNKQYTLRYVKKSIALTDVPDSISLLMAQRRRWINGSWFAMIDVIRQFKKVYCSGHTLIRKWAFRILLIYFVVNVICTWLMVGSFFLSLGIVLRNSFPQDVNTGKVFTPGDFLLVLYLTLIMIVLMISLAVKPRFVNDILKGISAMFGIFMLASFYFMLDYLLSPQMDKIWVLYLALGTISVFIICPLLHGGFKDIAKGAVHFIFLSPTYVNIFLIYAVCNTHDCTWGSRPDQLKLEEKLKLEEFEAFRAKWVVVWFLSNSTFAYFIFIIDRRTNDGFLYISGLAILATSVLAIRVVGSIAYLIKERTYRSYDADKDANAKSEVSSEDSRLTVNSAGFSTSRSEVNSIIIPPAISENPISISDDIEDPQEQQTPNFMDNANSDELQRFRSPPFVEGDINYGYNLKSLRESKGMTIEELGRLCNIEPQIIQEIEEGLLYPNLDQYKHLELVLQSAE